MLVCTMVPLLVLPFGGKSTVVYVVHVYVRTYNYNIIPRATVEPRVPNPQTGADLRRGDIKVHQGGTTWILDIGVVCPGTQRYVDQGSQTTAGRAAEAYAAIKAAKYADQQLCPIHCGDSRLHQQAGPPLPGHPTGVPGVPPRRRLSDPGVLQGTVTPRRRAQGGDAGSGSYPSLHARKHCSGDSRGRQGANAGQHTPTLSLPPSHHSLDGEVSTGCRVSSHNTRGSLCTCVPFSNQKGVTDITS
jgi:hypothetical protein